MKRTLVILGTGGGVYDVLDLVGAINAIAPTWDVAGFLDDSKTPGTGYLGLEILGPLAAAPRFPDCVFVSAIGSDKSYRRLPAILATTALPAEHFATLVHPAASVSAHARLGRGVVVNHGVSVGGGARIDNNVTLCPGCIIGHDTTIEEYSIVAPGAVVSGFVHVQPGSYIGAGAVIRQSLRIGAGSLVGMGAVVIREVAPDTVVVGNPARPLRTRPLEPMSSTEGRLVGDSTSETGSRSEGKP